MARLNPKVTVLIPVYNRERFVDEAIRSVMEQDFDDFELLLVEGGSTDRTPEVLEMWKKRDRRVVVVTTPTREGISAALNLGLAHARGKYVARLDSDDLMMPRRLAEQAAVLDAHSEVVLVSCAYDIVDLAGNRLGTWKRDEPPEVTAFLLHFFNVIGGHGQVMFRLAAALEEGGYARKLSEDYDLWVRLRRRGRIETLPFVGMAKRTHANQALVQSLERWDLRHATWSGIMRSSLEPYLRRTVRDDEIAALITVWRLDGRLDMARIADDVMRQAFARFRNDNPDRALQACARRRIARQWYIAARNFARRGHPLEAMKYLAHAASWLVTPRVIATA
ncbi:MAG TPA: glycosyltransferase family A protein [Thermoanaerobaculia bacterium]|nr:glycosyltransferase family A protein [Thermoanaerobaculia bacterium]